MIGTLSNKKMFRLAFNSSTVSKNNSVKFDLEKLDPDKVRDDPSFPKKFYIELYFQDMDDPSSVELMEQQKGMKTIEECIKYRNTNVKDTSDHMERVVFYGEEYDDRDEMMIVDTLLEDESDTSLDENIQQ